MEAHFLKTKCNQLEKKETEKFIKERNDKIRAKSEALAHKHTLEKNALRQKLDTELEVLNKVKEDEIASTVLKFKNKKMDLDKQQKTELNLSKNSNLMKQSKWREC